MAIAGDNFFSFQECLLQECACNKLTLFEFYDNMYVFYC